jgi:hypothetical protein
MAQRRTKRKDGGEQQQGKMPDDPGQAVESGEQGETGRSRGKVIDKDGSSTSSSASRKPSEETAGGEQHFESGRQQATPD